jgi:signal transduction histidine kinase
MITSGIMYVFIELTGNVNGKIFGRNDIVFTDSVKTAAKLVTKWSQSIDLQQMKTDVDSFNNKHSSSKIYLSIFKGTKLIYPTSFDSHSTIVELALSQQGSHMLTMDNVAVYRENAGDYSIILTGPNFDRVSFAANTNLRRFMFYLGIAMILFIVTIIFLTNQFLTRFVVKSITASLDTLVYGVRQIRDGNLNYHIEYAGKDEFADVCSDFNEMAQRLLDSVNARQKDEENRKELIAGISHDLRTPLTSIKAYLEGLEKGVAATPETQKRYLNTIRNKTNDLECIVNQLFLFSKLDIGEFPFYLQEVNIGDEITSMLIDLSEEYKKKGLEIILIQNIKNIYVQADVIQLRRAFINVLENSVKYKNKTLGQIRIACEADNNYVTIKFLDNGPGVSKDALPKLFDVFYRSDSARSNPSKGSGLGLAITSKIIERLGGLIKAQNIQDSGLAIIMMLPKYTGGESSEKNSDY